MNRFVANAVAGFVVIVAFSAVSEAQAPAIKRTLLQRTDLGDGREAIMGIAEIASGGSTGRHTHFGIEQGYVMDGTTTLEVEGEAPRLLKAGDSYTIPAGRVHNATATSGNAKVLASVSYTHLTLPTICSV